MKCSTCQWHNPGEATQCVMCRAPLASGGEPDFTSAFAQQPAPAAAATPAAVYLATDLSRTLATVIDGVQMLVSAAVWLVVVWDMSWSIWLKLLGAVVLFFLPALLDAGPGSLGKRCLKIQVVTTHGEKPSLITSMWRHFIKYVLHIALPIVWKLIEPWLTGGRHLHDVWGGTTVIERLPASARAARAAPELFHEALIAQAQGVQAGAAPQAPVRADVKNARQQVTRASRAFDVFKNLLAWCIAGALLWLFVPAVWSLYKESQDPTMSAVSDAKAATKKLTHLLSQRFEQGQSLELDWSDPALAALEAEMGAVFTSITTEPRGPVTLQIKSGPVAGKHIVLAPEYNFSKKSIKKWTCGSPDIERALLPTGCKAKLSTAPTTS
ncbi:RDD family protein [Acidovorax sp. LjRoot129]|uniref:RDD family protein n=1 Tax=Acidovorax sp. LjRoot129 TaxID=3342260 RepID=UPI003ECF6981